MYADTIAGIIFVVACGCVLPIVMALLNTRQKMNESEVRKQIVLAAIEKNKETDVEELLKKMAPKQKLLKEKLLSKLLWGCILLFLGIGTLVLAFYFITARNDFKNPFTLISPVLLAIGIGFLVNYFVGKKMLAKEIEAEEKKLTSEV